MPAKPAPAPKTDRRVTRTEARLARALIDLSLSQGYESITIRDLTVKAGVGYATFFRHYPDKEALLAAVLETVLADLMSILESGGPGGDAAGEGRRLFSYVQTHAELCRVLVGSPTLVRRLQQAGVRLALQDNRPRRGGAIPPEVAAHHVVAGTLALIQWWLENGLPYTPERMGQIYSDLIARPAAG